MSEFDDLLYIRGVHAKLTPSGPGGGWREAYRQDVGFLLAKLDHVLAETEDARRLGASINKAASTAVDAERAAVVRYLRGEAAGALNILDVADDIESGEHVAKEDK